MRPGPQKMLHVRRVGFAVLAALALRHLSGCQTCEAADLQADGRVMGCWKQNTLFVDTLNLEKLYRHILAEENGECMDTSDFATAAAADDYVAEDFLPKDEDEEDEKETKVVEKGDRRRSPMCRKAQDAVDCFVPACCNLALPRWWDDNYDPEEEPDRQLTNPTDPKVFVYTNCIQKLSLQRYRTVSGRECDISDPCNRMHGRRRT